MAKKVIWSLRAQNERKEILRYWINRNKAKKFSYKLNELFKDAVRLISDFPEIGKPTENRGVRIKIVLDYLIIYEIENNQIIILTIWDSRQNPDRLKLHLEE